MLVLAALLATTPDVLDVDPVNGPFLEIHEAVTAANSGDVIRFAQGTYRYFGVFGKSLTIVPLHPGDRAVVSGTVRIQNLGAGDTVVLADVDAASGSGDPGLLVANNLGAVRVEGATARGGTWNGAVVLGSSDVIFGGCSFLGGCSPSFGGCQGFTALRVEDSNVTLFGTDAVGATPSSYGYPGPPGVDADRSCLFVHGGTIEGGDGGEERTTGFGQVCSFPAGDGGDAISANDSEIRCRDAQLVPGDPGWNTVCSATDPAFPGVEVRLNGSSTLVRYDGAALELSLDARWYTDSSIAVVSADGTAGDTVLLVLGPATGRVNLPAYTGDLHVGGPLGGARRVLLGSAPAQTTLQLPDLPAFGVLQWTVQSVHLRPGGEVVFGPTRALNVIDSAW